MDAYSTKPDRIVKGYSTLTLFLFLLVVLAPLRTAIAQDRYEQQVLQQLGEASMAFTSVGYIPIIEDGDKLDHGSSENYTVTLETGRTYILMGVCDEDCLDLDMALYDGYDNLISRDDSEDDLPTVEVSVTQGGDFTLQVTMYQCNQNPCYYGVGLYGEAPQDRYEQQVLLQLDQVSMVFTSAGYIPIIEDGGKLDHGSSENYTVTLETGHTYILMGVCDEDCLDLDMALYDGYGTLISRDDSEDDVPTVEVSVTQGGDFTLQVTMYQCNQNPCYYGVGLYGN